MSVKAQKETLGFQTEVKQLLHLVVHSLYSNKEIFLRELISNASDALDKLRFAGLANSAIYEDDPDLKVRVSFDEKAQTISITDNGIGMSREEVIDNLGTIAKSGTREFLAHLTGDQKKDSHLIGQFGVGFYSSFMVADKVIVNTRKTGVSVDEGVQWESDGTGEYTIKNTKKVERGTEIILHLKEDAKEFLDDYCLRGIINKYSDHISWPIVMKKLPTGNQEEEESKENLNEEETVNKATALWAQPKKDISDEDYKEFYKHISHDFEEPLAWSHNRVEGKQEYINLLYIPAHAPFNMYDRDFKHGLKLFVQRVFVMDDAEQFLPRYLRFVKGIVDSNDLPLNVSREILQDHRLVDSIRAANVKKTLDMLEKLAQDDKEKYVSFWEQFGNVLKEGPIEDFSNRERIAKLLRFSSTHTNKPEQDVSLADCVDRMQAGQTKIYYITADSFNAAKDSPHLELFREKNIEVLLLSDRVDEWLVSHLNEYEGKQLQSVTKGKVDLGELEDEKTKELHEKKEKEFESVVERVKKSLADQVKDVRLTYRLTDSPACIVADEYDMGRQMERILKQVGQQAAFSKPILELNPEHPLVSKLNAEKDEKRFNDLSTILFQQALLAEGGQLDNPAQFVKRVNELLLEGLK